MAKRTAATPLEYSPLQPAMLEERFSPVAVFCRSRNLRLVENLYLNSLIRAISHDVALNEAGRTTKVGDGL